MHTYTTDFYNDISEAFHRTRHAQWPGVVTFLQSLPKGSCILDVGCGNGKYLDIRAHDCIIHACDKCPNLVKIARENHNHANIIEADGLSLPYPDASFDAVISIAVVHHLQHPNDRQRFMQELKRVAKPNAMILITVWATTAVQPHWIPQEAPNDFLVPWQNKVNRFYHVFSEEEALRLASTISTTSNIQLSFEKDNWYITVNTS